MKKLLSIGLLLSAMIPSLAFGMNLIRVTGQAEKKFQPDVAYLSIGVWSKAKDAKKAQEMNAQEFSRIQNILEKDFKIEKKLIKTQNFSLSPEFDFSQNKRTLTGYSSNHSIQVTVYQLDQIGKMVDTLISSKPVQAQVGVNIEDVRFGTEKTEAYETEVTGLAMNHAKTRAEAIAKAAGRSLKGVYSVVQGSAGVSFPRLESARMMTLGQDAAAKAPTTVPAGEINISTEVTVEYEF